MKKFARALSQRIKALREEAGLSQQDVAARGAMSLARLAKLEQGKKGNPRTKTLLALAGALGVRPGQLLDDLLPATSPEMHVPEPTEELVAVTANGHEEVKKEKKHKKDKPAKKKKKN